MAASGLILEGAGVVGIGVGLGVALGVGLSVAMGVGVGVAIGVALGVGLGVAMGLGTDVIGVAVGSEVLLQPASVKTSKIASRLIMNLFMDNPSADLKHSII